MAIDETARLAALRWYKILDTNPEQAFDDLVLLASHICGTPIALISLIDKERQWFKSKLGVTVSETSRTIAFCDHAIQQSGIFTVPDACGDERFRENPFVTHEPHIRFYAGAPLVTPEGHSLGTLCVLDHVPRTLTDDQERALDILRRQVEAQLELRRNLDELKVALEERDRAEASQAKLVGELRESLENVNKLTELIPFTSACELNITIPATSVGINTVSEGVMALLQRKHWSQEELIKIDLALQEALANGIRHGCKNDASKQVQCVVTCDASGELLIVVRDPGTGFDHLKAPDPLADENRMRPSGRGVFLINQLMDEVAFTDGGREVQMRKRRDVKRLDSVS